ncbi:MAG TPA: alpha/beta hydrolase [Gaiellaceae bacterium]|nr:alpha/beta hydrolase [Gaiellaceae bacterium]
MMGTINVGAENSAPIDLYYEDQGSGRAVVLLHGWPFDGRSWEPQLHPLLEAGYRVINYDRRGFGRSSAPVTGYDFDTLSADLDTVMRTLDLTDVSLVGFSLGTGEVARYIGRFGDDRVRSIVLIESLTPTFAKGPDNPQGVDAAGVDATQQAILADRYAWLTGLLGDMLNLDEYLGKRVSDEGVRAMWSAGVDASPWATWACPRMWLEDFSSDIQKIDVPVLLLHGTADRILNLDSQGRRAHAAMPDAEYIEIEGGPHLGSVTHATEINSHLLRFLAT